MKNKNKLEPIPFASTLAILSSVIMLLLGIAGNFGIYTGMYGMMQQAHMFFDQSVFGIITGMIEAAVISFIIGYTFVWIYNKLGGKL